MRRLGAALLGSWMVGAALVGPFVAPSAVRAAEQPRTVLLINQLSRAFPEASLIRGQQVLMLLRHFNPAAEIIADRDYRSGFADAFDFIVVLGNDAVEPMSADVLTDVRKRDRPTMWVGYGLGPAFSDPDRAIGFAADSSAPRRAPSASPIKVRRIDRPWTTSTCSKSRPRTSSYSAETVVEGKATPLAVHKGRFWFFGALPGLDTDYPDPAVDAPTLIFSDLLHDFFGLTQHSPREAIVRLEDVSVHIPPSRIIDAVDALARRGVPFVMGVIPAQRLADGSVLSIADRPDFVQALRYAQDRGGTIALHGYHHTFGQGEDYEFWDAARDAPPDGERWETYALKVEDGIRLLRDEGLTPQLWETPHYAASALGYQVFSHYFSGAIENRDPVTWLPFVSGPDPAGQTLIPENIGYINEPEGWTVAAQLARADLLRIVRDANSRRLLSPGQHSVSDLVRLVDGLSARATPSPTFGACR